MIISRSIYAQTFSSFVNVNSRPLFVGHLKIISAKTFNSVMSLILQTTVSLLLKATFTGLTICNQPSIPNDVL